MSYSAALHRLFWLQHGLDAGSYLECVLVLPFDMRKRKMRIGCAQNSGACSTDRLDSAYSVKFVLKKPCSHPSQKLEPSVTDHSS